MQYPVPFKDRFWCVYQHGLTVYTDNRLSGCIRYIGGQIHGNPNGWWKITIKQALDAGFQIRSV